MIRTMVPIVAVLAMLAGCQGEKKQEGAGTAAGEVLEGSTSDAMLPLDTVRSQAPLAPHSEGGDKAKDKPGKDDDRKAETEPAADQATPAAAPAPDEPAE